MLITLKIESYDVYELALFRRNTELSEKFLQLFML